MKKMHQSSYRRASNGGYQQTDWALVIYGSRCLLGTKRSVKLQRHDPNDPGWYSFTCTRVKYFWIKNWSHISLLIWLKLKFTQCRTSIYLPEGGMEGWVGLVLLLFVVVVVVQGSVASNWAGMKFGRIVLQVNTHRIFGNGVICSRQWPWRHFTQKRHHNCYIF